jgi:hypothetical protein
MMFEQATAEVLVADRPIAAPNGVLTGIFAHQEIPPERLTRLGIGRQRQILVALCQQWGCYAERVRAGT